ncbi:cob(I)yrinic acid a,c-diamide adenosyltransferase [Marinitoga aeolica]|uniref:Corrinoid adenosyltransferase n=1 Tax=Marinitoga aeolica TaxID=2809031 RepID=A0ABY8PS00_9BACT|nr:cob(I)yrinic acid a,c-diamide adenosyltransferase [Marinitoga aeolica]WGS65405.1 cob(I)yrinic acid a,c-diamide adenosyltransferase [Marinitoga aeolica]
MSISTGGGDKGKTSLWSGERVSKDDLRVEAYGTIDELSSFLGEAKHYVKSYKVKNIINMIQNDLFKVAGELASKNKDFLYRINDEDVEQITQFVKFFEKRINLKGFVLTGNTIESAKLDVCRTIVRRAERRIVSLSKNADISEPLLKYINRLSDLLFVMARYEEYLINKIEYKKW